MIKKLTPEQEAKIPEFREEFRKIGLSTEPCDRPKAEHFIRESYKYLKMKQPDQIFWFDSPKAGADFIAKENNLNDQQRKDLFSSASAGSFEAYWVSSYAYMCRVLPVKHDNLIDIVEGIIRNVGWYWTFEKAVICTERPAEIHFNHHRRLHKDLGAAILYRDGFRVYRLNGVAVPEKFILAKPEDINPAEVMRQTNVEIRRELFKKVGLDRMLSEMKAKILHDKDGYQLLELDIGDGTKGRYLKMINPSVGSVHVEGVLDECETVEQALFFRNRKILSKLGYDKFVKPKSLT